MQLIDNSGNYAAFVVDQDAPIAAFVLVKPPVPATVLID
jgi:hypothetical protein